MNINYDHSLIRLVFTDAYQFYNSYCYYNGILFRFSFGSVYTTETELHAAVYKVSISEDKITAKYSIIVGKGIYSKFFAIYGPYNRKRGGHGHMNHDIIKLYSITM